MSIAAHQPDDLPAGDPFGTGGPAEAAGTMAPAGAWREAVDLRLGWLMLPVLLYGLTFNLTRPLGQLPYLVMLALAALVCIRLGRPILFRAQGPLILIATFYLFFSLNDTLPAAWTQYHDNFAAVRQYSWLLAIPLFTTGFFVLLARYYELIVAHALKIAVVLYVISRISVSTNPAFFEGVRFGIFGLYSPNNETLPVYAALLIAAHRNRKPEPYQIGVLLLLPAVSSSVGTLLMGLMSIVLRFLPYKRLALYLMFAGLLTAAFLAPFFYDALYQLDNNTGVRAIFWHDAQLAVVQTWGVGVGYGTEYIANYFGLVGQYDWTITAEYDTNRLYISTHNTIYDCTMRLGLLGAVLMIVWLRDMIGKSGSALAAPLCAVVLISCSVAPVMVAIDTQIGISLLLAFILVTHVMQPDGEDAPNADAMVGGTTVKDRAPDALRHV